MLEMSAGRVGNFNDFATFNPDTIQIRSFHACCFSYGHDDVRIADRFDRSPSGQSDEKRKVNISHHRPPLDGWNAIWGPKPGIQS